MYQTVIFDLDGTLLDTIQDLADAGNTACRALGLPPYTVEEYLAMVGHGIPALIRSMLPEDRCDPETTARALDLFSHAYRANSMDRTRPYPGIVALLTRLQERDVAAAVCSNKADEFTQALVQHYFPDLFRRIQGKLPGVPTKPDPAGVRLILEALGADPATTLYVGDSDTDMLTGRNAGLTTCGVTWGFRSRQVLLDAGACQLSDSAQDLERLILG